MSSLLIPPPEDPVRAAAQWLGEAEALGRRNANAMALATRRRRGPAVRAHGAAQGARAAGLCRLLHELRLAQGRPSSPPTGRAAAVLYWHELGRQVRFEGPVVRSPGAESDALLREPAAAEPGERVEQRAEPAARRSGRARGARGQDRRDEHRRPSACRAPISGADSGSGSKPSSCGSKARTAFTSACATSAELDARDAHSFDAGPLELAAAATLVRPRAAA